ncbi:nitronate monooxygenase family protein [Legionella sp. km772]|uniref:NAD(P)H-dependent flavin oxidoreductase n=1 Tax=Legionella sp. km772 TaxID=2498111 RepID=UPI000F8C8623|nr:nitronate monooxygenase [Legionella sp. km772]RUR13890.1 nitronate monooxygenase [Legionella sp. km772]
MPLHTPICDLLNIKLPIFQGPMGGAASPAFAAAVANAGGLGTLPLGVRSSEEIHAMIKGTQALTNNALGVNLVLEWEQKERLAISLDYGIKNIWFFWGDPSPFVQQIHAAGAKVIHTVGSAEEAKRSVDAGVDVIVAQGWEAGGHLWGEVASLPLIPAVVDVVGSTPVIAAGGIADGRGLAAALALGASGVVIGTRLLASTEAGVHQYYKEKLLNSRETDTVYNNLFNIGWPNSWMRTLRNSTYENWQKTGKAPAGKRPGEHEIIAKTSSKEFPRYSYVLPTATMEGELEAMALYAGQSVGLVHEIKSVEAIFADIREEALAVFKKLELYR